ncbi:MAG: hypothetical protein ACRDGR_03305 [bacterium]
MVWLLGAGAATAGTEPAPAPSNAERYEELLRSFEDAFRAASERALDEATLLEAEEIAAIAEELLAEEETGIAVTLLEEAVLLLAVNAEP